MHTARAVLPREDMSGWAIALCNNDDPRADGLNLLPRIGFHGVKTDSLGALAVPNASFIEVPQHGIVEAR